MRIDQKYFIPFILGIASICVVVIIFFNLKSFGGQQERLVQALNDGSELYEYSFFEYASGDSIRISELDSKFIGALFFSSWSSRGINAFNALADLSNQHPDFSLLAMAVKDDEIYLADQLVKSSHNIKIVNGTEFYSDYKIPGLPSIAIFDNKGSLIGIRMGFTGSDDYSFLKNFLNE